MYGMNSAAGVFDGVNKYIRITDIDENTHKFSPSPIVSPVNTVEEKYKLVKNDLLFARTGASVGKSYLFDERDGDIYFAGFLIKFNIFEGNSSYIFSQTLLPKYNSWVSSMSVRSGQPGINAQEYKTLPIIFPPLSEQNRIVLVLETWDSGIEKLKQKITIKKEIKKGLMQELLTGKKRLPGFSDKWKIIQLGEVVEIIKNGVPSYEGLKKYYSTSAVLNEDKVELVSCDTKPSRANMYPEIKDIGIAKMKGTNRCFIVEKEWVGNIFSTGFSFLRTNKSIDYSFIYYLISDKKFQYFKDLYSASGIMGGIGNKDLLSIEIKIPQYKEEQEAISKIIITADTEITALEKKLTLWQEQKKYLLNNLVTGQIRTPENLLEKVK